MERGNESLDVVPVPNESAHCFSVTQGGCNSWNLSLFIHLYVFVCVMDYLCNCLIYGETWKELGGFCWIPPIFVYFIFLGGADEFGFALF